MHLNHKPGEIMQVDWAGDTTSVLDTDTGEPIKVYVFVATLPYSGYSYVEGFFSVNQECWTSAHVNAFKYFGGVTKSPSSMTMYMMKRFIVSGRIERPAQLLKEVDAGDLTAGE